MAPVTKKTAKKTTSKAVSRTAASKTAKGKTASVSKKVMDDAVVTVSPSKKKMPLKSDAIVTAQSPKSPKP